MTLRVLLIKMTSMGDLIHALPAITDASKAIPGVQFDWVADEAFADIPSWHNSVNHVITSAHRRWKKNIRQSFSNGELQQFKKDINKFNYDVILDTQNNLKSAAVSWLCKGHVHGLDRKSVREQPAHWAYTFQHHIDRNQHSIDLQRQLFAKALNYELPNDSPDFGINTNKFIEPEIELPNKFVFFTHNASWATKLWPESHWLELIKLANDSNYTVLLPNGNREELDRATRLASNSTNAVALPKLRLSEIAFVMNKAAASVCCDTGLGHIAGMLNIPSVSFYGPTDAKLVSSTGENQHHFIASTKTFTCSPCYKKQCDFKNRNSDTGACMEAFKPETVWEKLSKEYLLNH